VLGSIQGYFITQHGIILISFSGSHIPSRVVVLRSSPVSQRVNFPCQSLSDHLAMFQHEKCKSSRIYTIQLPPRSKVIGDRPWSNKRGREHRLSQIHQPATYRMCSPGVPTEDLRLICGKGALPGNTKTAADAYNPTIRISVSQWARFVEACGRPTSLANRKPRQDCEVHRGPEKQVC
jgi:hypothetical protein